MNKIQCDTCDFSEYVNDIFFETVKSVKTNCTNREKLCNGVMKGGKD